MAALVCVRVIRGACQQRRLHRQIADQTGIRARRAPCPSRPRPALVRFSCKAPEVGKCGRDGAGCQKSGQGQARHGGVAGMLCPDRASRTSSTRSIGTSSLMSRQVRCSTPMAAKTISTCQRYTRSWRPRVSVPGSLSHEPCAPPPMAGPFSCPIARQGANGHGEGASHR